MPSGQTDRGSEEEDGEQEEEEGLDVLDEIQQTFVCGETNFFSTENYDRNTGHLRRESQPETPAC